MKFEDFDLRQDPFPIAPESSVDNWAGDHELRDDLVDIVKGVRGSDIGVSEFVVVYGELGAGKSHALRYLKTLISEQPEEYHALAIYLERPRVASKLNFELLSRYIIQQIGRERINKYCGEVHKIVEDLVQHLADEAGMGNQPNKSSFYEAAFERFRENDRPMVRLLANGTKPGSKVFEFLSGDAKADVAGSYEAKVDSDFMAAKVLADLFRILTTDLNGRSVIDAVYLFIDECEMLLEAKLTESENVFAGLRELINGLPYRFGLMMSFSAATALIEAIMPSHMLKRLTRSYFEVPMLDDDLALEFLRTQLNFYRTPSSSREGTFYPFSDEAVDVIIGNEVSLTPRTLFIACKRVFERALRRYDLQPGETISADVARKVLGID